MFLTVLFYILAISWVFRSVLRCALMVKELFKNEKVV